MSAFRDAYKSQVAYGELEADPGQEEAIEALDRLAGLLEAPPPGLLSGILHRRMTPDGLYLWGGVGRGKTMLVNLFYDSLEHTSRQRQHFHAFMRRVHTLLEAGEATPEGDRSADAVGEAANRIREDGRLLCLDEFEVTDIGDAMILARLFDALFERGVVLVTTSNVRPGELYRDGPNRELFLPFIARLQAHTRVVEVCRGRDHRTDGEEVGDRYLHPVSPDTQARFDAAWRAALHGDPERADSVGAHGRTVVYSRAAGDRVRVTFDEMCRRDLGADDQLAFAERFDVVFLEAVPRLPDEHRDEARRLVTLIDALYEARAALTVLAQAPQEQIFENPTQEDHARTVSRLREMASASWGKADARPGGAR